MCKAFALLAIAIFHIAALGAEFAVGESSDTAAPRETSTPYGTLDSADCDVSLQHEGHAVRVDKLPVAIYEGDVVACKGARGAAHITLPKQTSLRLVEGSLRIGKYLDRGQPGIVTAIGGTFRQLDGAVKHIEGNNALKLVVNTPTGTLGIRGTKFRILQNGSRVNLMTFAGEVLVHSTVTNKEARVRGGFELHWDEHGLGQLRLIRP